MTSMFFFTLMLLPLMPIIPIIGLFTLLEYMAESRENFNQVMIWIGEFLLEMEDNQ